MAKYILIYELDGFPEEGGGLYLDEFGMNEQDMHKRVQELITEHKSEITITLAGFMTSEWKYKVVEYAKVVIPERG